MPSIVIQSEAFRVAGLVLQSQSVTEDATGLVSASITYITTPSKRNSVARLFYPDSQPPIFPSSINKDELQGRNLFLVDRSIDQFGGLVTIQAKYVGALNRALAKPSITFGREIKTVSFSVNSGYLSGTSGGGVNFVRVDLYDYYDAQITTGVKEYSVATIQDKEYDIQSPSFSDLFLGCSFTKITLNGNLIDLGLTGVDIDLPNPLYDRNTPAKDLVFKHTASTVGSDLSYNFYTPTVKIQKKRFFLNIRAI
jgi:hypothetical protein